jgi:hypothetical protein
VTPLELLQDAEAHGLVLRVDGDELKMRPATRCPPALRVALRDQKPAIIALLAPDRFITFKGGLTVPVAAWILALDLESRGIALAVDPADRACMMPSDPRVSPADRAAIQQWRVHLAAVLDYRVPHDQLPQ